MIMSSASAKRINEFGLTEVFSPPKPLVDVVFVHGLNGHPYDTWSTHDSNVFWPRDLLPQDVDQEGCRILTYGYDANVSTFKDGASKDHIHYHAETLTARLAANRSRLRALERPLIFVVHSLGGLVVKRMLIHSNESTHLNQERLRSIFTSTYGILFLGTPHNGSDLAKWGSILQSICAVALPKKMFDTQSQLIKALETNNETLQLINRDFTTISTKFRIYFFHEAKPMDLKGTRQFVVDEDSAAPNLPGVERAGIEKDHSSMCKFEDVNSPGYDLVSEAIQRYAAEAPVTISGRWQAAKRDQQLQKQDDVREMFGDDIPDIINSVTKNDSAQLSRDNSVSSTRPLDRSLSQASNAPLLVAPLGFRPNSIFKGFELELEWLDRKLKSASKAQLGTTSVLLWGPPGCGKSHLARQYIFTHRHENPAGTFWVDCNSTDTLLRGYWNIGRRLGCLNDSHSSLLVTDSPFIHTVREALQEQHGWILVFDGILCTSEDEIGAFQQYLPDSQDNKIIYTSVNKTLARRHRLLVPSALRVPKLTKTAACELLFASLNINSRIATPLQRRKAAELVQYYRYLPLGIHAAAYALIARGRVLERFVPGRSDSRLSQPFLDIFETLEEGNYTEALTLLTLLSFIYHRVPVALLHFGASFLLDKGFGIESADPNGDIRKHIDNTIAILIQRGLVERQLQLVLDLSTDQEDSSPEASRKSTYITNPRVSNKLSMVTTQVSRDTSGLEQMVRADEVSLESARSILAGIDTLRTHSVVQNVVRDTIKGDRSEYHRWLVLASQFLLASYDTAQRRQSFSTVRVTVTDYHEFRTHGEALLKHFPSTEREVSRSLFDARHNLRNLLRTITKEIQDQSPLPSSGSNQAYRSVFDLSSTSSEHSPDASFNNLSRSTTWSLSRAELNTESPTDYRQDKLQDVNDRVKNEFSANPEGHSMVSARNVGTQSKATMSVSKGESQAATGPSILEDILTGYHPGKRKNLGEFRRLPTANPVEWRVVEPPSNTTWWPYQRRSSSNSEAERSLAAALRAQSPSSAPRSAVSLAQPNNETLETPEDEALNQAPLGERSPNVPMPTSPAELPTKLFLKNSRNARMHQRTTSSSPRLRQAVLASRAATSWAQEIPIERNIAVTRRSDIMTPTINTLPVGSSVIPSSLPSGYCSSIPMSRNPSADSQLSVPVLPVRAFSAATSPTIGNFEPYSRQSEALPSIALNSRPSITSARLVATGKNSTSSMENDLGQTIEVSGPSSPSLPIQSREQSLQGLGVSDGVMKAIIPGSTNARV